MSAQCLTREKLLNREIRRRNPLCDPQLPRVESSGRKWPLVYLSWKSRPNLTVEQGRTSQEKEISPDNFEVRSSTCGTKQLFLPSFFDRAGLPLNACIIYKEHTSFVSLVYDVQRCCMHRSMSSLSPKRDMLKREMEHTESSKK